LRGTVGIESLHRAVDPAVTESFLDGVVISIARFTGSVAGINYAKLRPASLLILTFKVEKS